MNAPIAITAEIAGGLLVLGSASLVLARQALKEGWVRFSVSFAAVPPGKRWALPLGEPEVSAGSVAESPAAPAISIGDGRRVS